MYFPVSALLIEYMILSVVESRDSYGYEISQTTSSQEYQGRKRKYYSLTEEGKAQIAYLSNEWQIYKDTVDGIIEGRIKG